MNNVNLGMNVDSPVNKPVGVHRVKYGACTHGRGTVIGVIAGECLV